MENKIDKEGVKENGCTFRLFDGSIEAAIESADACN